MKIKLVLIILITTFWGFCESKIEIEANAMSQEAALLLGQEKFNLKGSYEYGLLKEGESQYMALTLYKSNTYALNIGRGDKVETCTVFLYDEDYNLVEKDSKTKNELTRINITPEESGTYYLKISIDKGATEKENLWIFVYGYKSK